MYLQVGGVVARVVRAVVGLAGLAALVEHLHPGLEHIELLPVLPRFRAAALELGLHVVPEEPRHRVLLVNLVVADGLLQLALGHLDLVAKVEEHDEDAAGRGTEEHEKDDDVGPYGVKSLTIRTGKRRQIIDYSLTEHASVGARGAAESEEGEEEEEPEDGYDDEDEREVERRRVLVAQLRHDLEV